jgi:acyl carrier protein
MRFGMKQNILNIVTSSVNSVNQLIDKKVPIELGETAPLYGSSGVLDSLSLVNLIVSVEEGIEDEFGVAIILASEKAMSQRKSPFSTIGALADYIETLIKGWADHV